MHQSRKSAGIVTMALALLAIGSLKAQASAGFSLVVPALSAGNYAVAQSSPPAQVASVSAQANPTTIKRNQTTLVTATAHDAASQPVAGAAVSFVIVSGPGSINPASGTTNGSGQAATTFTAPASFSGASVQTVIQACSNGFCGSATVTTTKK